MRFRLLIAIVSLVGLAACDSVLDTNPRAAVPSDEAVQSAKDAEAAIRGIYSMLQADDLFGQYAVILPDIYSDDLQWTGTFTTLAEFDNNNVFPDNVSINDGWTVRYLAINRANSALQAIEGLEEIDDATRSQLLGEALFLRGLVYFDLTRYFGGVPIVLEPTTGADAIETPARNTLEEVYAQVEADLLEAESLLPVAGEMENGRASRYAASALLARLYLYQERFGEAAEKATQVIDSGDFALVDDFAQITRDQNTSESILEIQFSTNDQNSLAFWFFPDTRGGRQEYAPTAVLASAFEEGDERLSATIADDGGNLFGVKYFRIENGTDNVMVIRLAEMYLIRAEALARTNGDIAAIQADVDVIRDRAGLEDTEAATHDALLDAILQERRVEFALEGHRFFDLRRTGRAQEVLGIESPSRLLFPIPQAEIDVNPNLEQNPGY